MSTRPDFHPWKVSTDDWRKARAYLIACTDAMLSAPNYIGDRRPAGMLCSFIGQNRDSDALTRSNFRVALSELEAVSEAVEVRSVRCWAHGWREAIYVPATRDAVEAVAGLWQALDRHPVLDEADWSELEYEEGWDFWKTGGGRSDVASELPDHIRDALDDGTVPEAIVADIWQAGAEAYFAHGFGEDSWDTVGAAAAMVDRVDRWHRLARWVAATSNGRQRELF